MVFFYKFRQSTTSIGAAAPHGSGAFIVSHLPGIHLYVVFQFPQYFPANTSKRGRFCCANILQNTSKRGFSSAWFSPQIHLNVVFVNCYFLLSLFTFFHCEKFTFLIDLKNQNTSKRGFLSVYSFSTNTSKRGRKTI